MNHKDEPLFDFPCSNAFRGYEAEEMYGERMAEILVPRIPPPVYNNINNNITNKGEGRGTITQLNRGVYYTEHRQLQAQVTYLQNKLNLFLDKKRKPDKREW